MTYTLRCSNSINEEDITDGLMTFRGGGRHFSFFKSVDRARLAVGAKLGLLVIAANLLDRHDSGVVLINTAQKNKYKYFRNY